MVAVKLASNVCLPLGAPTEIRTLVLALKGLRPGPLDDGGNYVLSDGILPLPALGVKENFPAISGNLQGKLDKSSTLK